MSSDQTLLDIIKQTTGLTVLQLIVSAALILWAIGVLFTVSLYIYLKYTNQYWNWNSRERRLELISYDE